MGVSGSGKSSVGRLLAEQLSVAFVDADDHHSPSSIEKMSQGLPLTDGDREPWLININKIATGYLNSGVVIACSALKQKYRIQLSQSIEPNVLWVYLKGDYSLILERMKSRSGHFMRADMLASQFETLEEPKRAAIIDIVDSLDSIVETVMKKIESV